MDFTNVIKTFEGDELKKIIINPLIDELTAMNKYTVLPVYALQFVINKLDMKPRPILTAYDNKALITEASSLIPHLEDVIHEKTPKNITPTVIVYPEDIGYSDVIIGKDDYHYSSAYLIAGKELKDNLKNGLVNISKVEVVSDMGQFNIMTKIHWNLVDETKDDIIVPTEQCIEPMPFTIKLFKLPFSNYAESIKSLRTIVTEIANVKTEQNSLIISDDSILADIANNVKEDQMIDIPGTESIKIFKDFVKVKPTKAFTVFKRECYTDDTAVTSVFFEMYFKSSHLNVGIFYRYLDNIFDTLSGVYKE